MEKARKTRIILIAVLALICIAVLIFAFCGKKTAQESPAEPAAEATALSDDELYETAVHDAVFIDEDEVLPLVNIRKDDENVLWDGERVLVLFMHKYPDSYPAGEDIELQWGNVWCVSAKEACDWVKKNGEGVEDWTLRLHQVLGMPVTKEYTTITALWVDANLLYRPANVTDANSPMETTYQPTGNEDPKAPNPAATWAISTPWPWCRR